MKSLYEYLPDLDFDIFFLFFILLFFIWILLIYRHYRIHIYAWFTDFPKPKFRVTVEKNTMIPMPDGTRLATDIYRPKSLDKFPGIIIRTAYNKSGHLQPYKQFALLLASQGYVVIVQDVRGKYKSEGEFYPYAYEALDGHTTITWAGEEQWSNGKLAIAGISYSGSCAWLAARHKSKYLRTMITMFTSQDTYSLWIEKGIPFLKGTLLWLGKYCAKKENLKVTDRSIKPFLWKLPVNRLDERITNRKILFYREFLSHIQPGSFWNEISAHQAAKDLDISAFIVGGWYDPFLKGTIEDYHRMKQAPKTSMNHYSHLMIGPWAHNPAQKFEGIEFGANANFKSIINYTLEWCDIWLKDKKRMEHRLSKVRYFIMGKNEWREADSWPPTNTTDEKYFLSNQNNVLNPTEGLSDGLLTPAPPDHTQKTHYIYNPRDPVLFRGGYMLHGEGWIAPIEQGEIIRRDEVLIYSTPILNKEVCIAGAAKLILYVSSQALDTDFCAKICDMHPNGKTYNLSSGFIRMRFRDSLEDPQLMIPGNIYRVEIVFGSVAHAFLKDHRIQLQITSSDFPVHNRNLNTGMSCETSVEIREVEQTIYSGKDYESHLILPILGKDEEGKG